jgi:KaiC/GvpD/RAD55 family RecA-like ATPase
VKTYLSERISVGIEGLDALVQGGFLKHSTVLLIGPPGVGKSIFCQQFVWDGLKKNDYALYFVLDFPPLELTRRMNRFGWDITPYESADASDKRIFVVDAFSGATDLPQQTSAKELFVKNPANLDEIFAVFDTTIQRISSLAPQDSAIRIVVDSVSPILSTVADFSKVYRFLRRLVVRISLVENVVALFAAHLGMHGENIETSLKQLTGNCIELLRKVEGDEMRAYLRIDHLRETYHTNKMIPYIITNKGLLMNPQGLF